MIRGTVFPIGTASGAIASFPDGGSNVPLKSLVVNIEPVQSLNGYDNPWPAGGGKNLLTALPSPANLVWFCEPNGFTFKANQTYCFSIGDSVTVGSYSIYAADKTTQLAYATSNRKVTYTPTVDTVGYPRLYAGNGVSQEAINSAQLELGNSRTDFLPYANICPISGWTGVKVNRTGKNLLRLVQSEMTSNGWNRRFPFSIKAGSYKISCQNQFGGSADKMGQCLTWFDKDGNVTKDVWTNYSFGYGTMSGTLTFTESQAEQTAFIEFRPRANGLTYQKITDAQIMLEAGETATTYEPYTGTVIPISFGEAGTVYGGTLDVTTGVLTVTKVALIIDGTTFKFTTKTSYGTLNRFSAPYLSGLIAKYNSTSTFCLSDKMTPSYANTISATQTRPAGYYCFPHSSSFLVSMPSDVITTITEANAWAAQNTPTVCYELATSQTYQLTSTEVITLLGENNIWADIGNVSLEYWKQISAIRGTSVYTTAAVPTSREILSDGVTTTQYGYILTIWDEKKYVLNPSSYTGDKFEIWNGIDGIGTVNSVDGFNVTGGTTNVQLDAVSFGRTQLLDAETQQTARTNIDAFQDVPNPANGQIPRYFTESSKWLPRNLTPEEVGAVHSALTINGKAITNPTASNASIVLDVNDIAGAVPASMTINGYALNTNITLTPNDIGALNSTLTINGKTITNPTTDSASIKLDVNDVGAVPTTRTINGRALTANIRTQIIASNKSVSTWSAVNTSSSIYNASFPYYANISISGVTTNMIPEVVFDINDNMSGIFAPIAKTINGGVQIYASEIPENTITIPTIICFN